MLKVSAEQIRLMKHTTGLERDKLRKTKYKPYRNYYTAPCEQESWEDLVRQELATKTSYINGVEYCITNKGFELLSIIFEIKIIKE